MSKKIQAISAYRPRIKKNSTASEKMVAARMEDRSQMSIGQVRAVFSDFGDTAMFYLLNRQDVELGEMGKFIIDIGLDGTVSLGFKVNARYLHKLDALFKKNAETIENAEHIGKNGDQLCDVWDVEHPDDPIERG